MIPEIIDLPKLHGVPFLITTIRQAGSDLTGHAQKLAEKTGQQYVERSLGALQTLYQQAKQSLPASCPPTGILVVRQKDYVVWLPHGELFQYHPGMAVHRVKALRSGGSDPMIEAMELTEGDQLLDCTAGLCSDALVASTVVGDRGLVRALEASLPVAVTVARGLRSYRTDRKGIESALRRIQLVAAQARSVLPQLPSESYDVVYFDPMFDEPVVESVGIAPLRHLADPSPLTPDLLAEAARVARRAVVVKARSHSTWPQELPLSRFVGGSKRRVGYAVITGDERQLLLEGSG